ncbi:hypothetical protein OS493_011972 [Desmophyllum pertusum]|uniref:Uncharacterized protein n=1 Tax=Desmophyllum pertusum TaxID=174260 RepID=A0A9X0A3E9_9CNID|nr:hypothetical protein OS493_011972 [Desmophyllum pertusum]
MALTWALEKCNNYETFTRNVELLRRTSDMFLRHMRIIERVQLFRDLWEQWTSKAKSAGGEHENRLNNFRKSRDRKEKKGWEHERVIRLERDKKREEFLAKKRFRLPKIIVTQYEDKLETFEARVQSSKKRETPSVLPNLVSIPRGSENEKGRKESDADSQGSRLELPDSQSYTQEGSFDDIAQADEQYESLLLEHENKEEAVTDGADSNSQETDVGVDMEDKSEENVLENDVSQSEVAIEPESDLMSENSVNTKIDEQNIKHTEQELDNRLHEQDNQFNAANENGTEEFEVKEREGRVEEKENETVKEKKEIQMNFLVPPSVTVMAGENGSDNGSIGDADETASLMGAFIPVAMALVATQGYPTASSVKVHKKDKCWVESYTLSFSTDGSQWQQYTENGAVKVFKGNRNNNSVVINSLSHPMEARFVRFIPQSWKSSIAMRVEVYGEVIESDMARNTPPPLAEGEEEEQHIHEVILEDEEEQEMEEFVCGDENKEVIVQQDAWEEETVYSVVETASQIQSKVAVVSRSSQSMIDLTVQGEKHTPKTKRRSKKPKQDKQEENEEKKKKKKKKKKVREKKAKDPLETSLTLLDDAEEEEGASSPEEEEEEQQEETERNSPSLPEIPKRPESVTRIPPAPKRTFSMFPVRKESRDEPSKPAVRRRAQTDDSIRNELMRQQLAEDRRKKLEAVMDKPKKEIQAQSPVYDSYGDSSGLDNFLSKYCIISEGQANYYRRVFQTFDEDKNGVLFPEDLLEALESVNSNLLSDSHINYIYRVLELCDCSLDSGVDFKLFSVVAAFSQRVAVLDEFAKILISKLDFRELDFKLQRAKRLFLCYVDEEKKTISLEELMLGLTAGGLTTDQKEATLKIPRQDGLFGLSRLFNLHSFVYSHPRSHSTRSTWNCCLQRYLNSLEITSGRQPYSRENTCHVRQILVEITDEFRTLIVQSESASSSLCGLRHVA